MLPASVVSMIPLTTVLLLHTVSRFQTQSWTVRRCCAVALEALATLFESDLVQFLVPHLNVCFQSVRLTGHRHTQDTRSTPHTDTHSTHAHIPSRGVVVVSRCRC
jgi:hypothetical protein